MTSYSTKSGLLSSEIFFNVNCCQHCGTLASSNMLTRSFRYFNDNNNNNNDNDNEKNN